MAGFLIRFSLLCIYTLLFFSLFFLFLPVCITIIIPVGLQILKCTGTGLHLRARCRQTSGTMKRLPNGHWITRPFSLGLNTPCTPHSSISLFLFLFLFNFSVPFTLLCSCFCVRFLGSFSECIALACTSLNEHRHSTNGTLRPYPSQSPLLTPCILPCIVCRSFAARVFDPEMLVVRPPPPPQTHTTLHTITVVVRRELRPWWTWWQQ